jgi:tRNA-dihydrouridine synthase 1
MSLFLPRSGCPQGIAKRGRYGAFLMEELDLLTDIVQTISKDLKVPVTCKTRIYKDFNRTIRLCETLTNAGASLLTIHGRTREEKKQMIGVLSRVLPSPSPMASPPQGMLIG